VQQLSGVPASSTAPQLVRPGPRVWQLLAVAPLEPEAVPELPPELPPEVLPSESPLPDDPDEEEPELLLDPGPEPPLDAERPELLPEPPLDDEEPLSVPPPLGVPPPPVEVEQAAKTPRGAVSATTLDNVVFTTPP
jgi:hypothetical protein